jgi:hypothetical protein
MLLWYGMGNCLIVRALDERRILMPLGWGVSKDPPLIPSSSGVG